MIGDEDLLAPVTFVRVADGAWRGVVATMWRGRLFGLIAAALTIALAVAAIQTVDFRYRATMTVAPAQRETGLSRSLSGLASLAGVNLSRGEGVSPFALYLQMLHSRDVAEALHRNNAVMIRLFPKRWDSINHRWHRPAGFVAEVARAAQSSLGIDTVRPDEPSVADVEKFLDEKLDVVENRRDSLADIGFADPDRQFAGDFVRMIHTTSDELLRARGLERATRFARYLNREIGIVQVAELRTSLAEALADQEKQRMTALSGLAFAAESVGGITVSARANEPNPVLLVATGIAAAVGLGLLAAYSWGLRTRRMTLPADA